MNKCPIAARGGGHRAGGAPGEGAAPLGSERADATASATSAEGALPPRRPSASSAATASSGVSASERRS